jgi:hypothetical protein
LSERASMPSQFPADIIKLAYQLQNIIDKNLKLAESIGPETRTAIETILHDHPEREYTPESQSSRSNRLRSPLEPDLFPTEWLNSKHTFNAALRRFIAAVKPSTISPPDTSDSQSQRQTPESGTTEEITREGVPSGSGTHVTMPDTNPNNPGSAGNGNNGNGLTPDMREDIVQLITQTI